MSSDETVMVRYDLTFDDADEIQTVHFLESVCDLSAFSRIDDKNEIEAIKDEVDRYYAFCLQCDNAAMIRLAEQAMPICNRLFRIVDRVAENVHCEPPTPSHEEVRDYFIERVMRGAYHPAVVMEGLYRALMIDQDGKPMHLWALGRDLEPILTYWRQMMDWSRVIVHESAEVGYAEAVNNQFEKFFKGIADHKDHKNARFADELRDWMMFMAYKKENLRDATSHPEDFHYWA